MFQQRCVKRHAIYHKPDIHNEIRLFAALFHYFASFSVSARARNVCLCNAGGGASSIWLSTQREVLRRYVAKIKVAGKTLHLGYFSRKSEADIFGAHAAGINLGTQLR